jgi:hypothetical protein
VQPLFDLTYKPPDGLKGKALLRGHNANSVDVVVYWVIKVEDEGERARIWVCRKDEWWV